MSGVIPPLPPRRLRGVVKENFTFSRLMYRLTHRPLYTQQISLCALERTKCSDQDKIPTPDGSQTPSPVYSVHGHSADAAVLTHEILCLLFRDLTEFFFKKSCDVIAINLVHALFSGGLSIVDARLLHVGHFKSSEHYTFYL